MTLSTGIGCLTTIDRGRRCLLRSCTMKKYSVIVIPTKDVEALIEFLDEHEVFDDVVDGLLEAAEVEEVSNCFSLVARASMKSWGGLTMLEESGDFILHYRKLGGGYDGHMPTFPTTYMQGGGWFYDDGKDDINAGEYLYRTKTQTLLQLGDTEAIRKNQIVRLIEGVH